MSALLLPRSDCRWLSEIVIHFIQHLLPHLCVVRCPGQSSPPTPPPFPAYEVREAVGSLLLRACPRYEGYRNTCPSCPSPPLRCGLAAVCLPFEELNRNNTSLTLKFSMSQIWSSRQLRPYLLTCQFRINLASTGHFHQRTILSRIWHREALHMGTWG